MERVAGVIRALEKNNMRGYLVNSPDELIKKIEELVPKDSTVSVGGSMTLFETGVIDHLRSGRYKFLDRYTPGLQPQEIKEIFKRTFTADAYFTSSNAITEDGELYNVDGTGNRVGAMLFGPDRVIVVAGINKIVKDEHEAVERNRTISAPLNAKRLNRKTPCVVTGTCHDCKSPERICSKYVLMKRQPMQDRIHVLFLPDNYGY